MPRHYIGERSVHDAGNFKEFFGSKDSRDPTSGSSADLDLSAFGVRSEAVNMFLIQKPVNPKSTPVARVIQRNETT